MAAKSLTNLFKSLHLYALLGTLVSLVPASFGSTADFDLGDDVLSRAQKIASNKQTRDIGQCEACRKLVNSFEHGLKQTSRGKFEGGDASWEEAKLKSYKDSELRLIEIQEKLCSDLDNGKEKCQLLAEQSESDIEEWWFRLKNDNVDLLQHLCIKTRKVCCPEGKYGPDCKECPGYPDNICSKRGNCKGNGTRKGNGKCSCHKGYTGDMCTKCAVGFYEDSSESTTDIPDCLPCDSSCLGHCRGKGPRACEVCKEGFIWDEDYGCLDTDECLELGYNPCKDNTFCVNTEGSYQCFQCDKSCDGCTGDGPDVCKKCAAGYILKDGVCIDGKTSERESQMEMSRYATYVGLCIAICIIFRKNIYIASVIGMVVAIYIALAEYTVRDSASNPFHDTLFGKTS